MFISSDIRYVGVNDHAIDLFEGQYAVPHGMAYNSYVLLDERIAVMDTVDARFGEQWLAQVRETLAGRAPDYLIVQHMEPDHSANIQRFMDAFPGATLVSSMKAFAMMRGFFGTDFADRRRVIADGDTLCLGRHTLTFVAAPMVHWPEVMVTYDAADRVLFSADGFGKFGALDVQEDWADEARRYYIGIVGKYGAQVQALLKKAAALDIATICPLHGPVLTGDLSRYVKLYQTWSSYEVEEEGIVVACASVYGHTREAAQQLAEKLRALGCPKVVFHDLNRCDMAAAVADAFRFSKLVLAATTYNADVFPCMRTFLEHLAARGFRNRTVALMENGSWAPQAAATMKKLLEGCAGLQWAEPVVQLRSALSPESRQQLDALAEALCRDWRALRSDTANKHDLTALFRLGYGLYVVTCRDGSRDNGLIVNTVTQVTNTPNRIAVTINKQNYSHDVIRKTGIMNVCCLSTDAPFALFKRFGFQSGRNVDKFAGETVARSDNGLAFLSRHCNALLSLKVEQYLDLDTHGMFICTVTEARVLSDLPTMTYTDYQEHVKPKPETQGRKGFVCKVCGYVYEGDTLPADFVCPLCKHGAADFEPLK